MSDQNLINSESSIPLPLDKRISQLFNAIPIPLALNSYPDFKFIQVNDTFLKSSSLNRDEIIGTSSLDLKWKSKLDLEKFADIMEGKSKLKSWEMQIYSRTGEINTSLFSAERIEINGKCYILSASIDITERKRAEEALRESERFNHSLLQNAPNPIMVANPDGSIQYVNPALEKLTGYSSQELIGCKFPYPWWPRETAQKFMDNKILGTGQDRDLEETRLIKKNGEDFWTIFSIRAIKENGEVLYLLSNWVDITGRKKAEAALTESEAFKNSLLHESPNPILVFNLDRSVRYVNPALEKLTGYSNAELIGAKPPFPWWPREKAEQYASENLMADHGKVDQLERRIIRKDGSSAWIAIATGGVSEQGKNKYLLANWTDITERKLVEEALKASEAFNVNLIYDSPNPIVVSNRDGSIRYVNSALERLTGYSAGDLIGVKTPYPWWPQENIVFYEQESLLTKVQGMGWFERRFIKKNGEPFWVSLSINCIKDETGIKSFISNWADITERKKMEERIIDLYEKEKQQRQELQEEAKSRGLFIDVLAHELRTPVTPILASIGMLKDLQLTQPDSIQKKLVENIYNSTQTLAQRLEELLDLARYSRGAFKVHIQTNDTQKFLNEVITRLKPMLEQRHQTLILDMPVTLSLWNFDPSRLEQVIINLLANASKFSPDYGSITFTASIQNNSLRIDVKDEGIGILPEDQQKLFQPYHRVQQDRQLFPGLGLGLTISKQIVEAHGGNIWVSSQPGKGSVFSFIIPSITSNPG